jgi:hypothetical protein
MYFKFFLFFIVVSFGCHEVQDLNFQNEENQNDHLSDPNFSLTSPQSVTEYTTQFGFEHSATFRPGITDKTRFLDLHNTDRIVALEPMKLNWGQEIQSAKLKIWVVSDHIGRGTGVTFESVEDSTSDFLDLTVTSLLPTSSPSVFRSWSEATTLDTSTILSGATVIDVTLLEWDLTPVFTEATQFIKIRNSLWSVVTFLSTRTEGFEPQMEVSYDIVDQSFQSSLQDVRPRIWINSTHLNQYQTNIASNSALSDRHDVFRARALGWLSEPLDTYITSHSGDNANLWRARALQRRIVDLAFLNFIEPSSLLTAKAMELLEHSATQNMWNVNHFLDIAELNLAYSIAYDWLHADLTVQQKSWIRTQLLTNGLQLGSDRLFLRTRASWAFNTNNWNTVCVGSLGAAALALSEVNEMDPMLEAIVARARDNLSEYSIKSFAPEGSWYEGQGYLEFALQFYTAFFSSHDHSLGSVPASFKTTGVQNVPSYAQHLVNNEFFPFNYGDAAAGWFYLSPYVLYLSQFFGKDNYLNFSERGFSSYVASPLSIAYLKSTYEPTIKEFQTEGVAFMRDSWADPFSSYVGFKGGSLETEALGHGDLDIGSFIYSSQEVRWFYDLGMDNYSLPNYFVVDPATTPNRWFYTRKRASNHNTLVFPSSDIPDQKLGSFSPVTRLIETVNQFKMAVIDMTTASNQSAVTLHKRGLILNHGLLIHDEFVTNATLNSGAMFNLIVRQGTEVRSDGTPYHHGYEAFASNSNVVTLFRDVYKDGGPERRYLQVKILSPNLSWQVEDPSSPHSSHSGQNSLTAYKKLFIEWENIPAGEHEIIVECLPYAGSAPTPISWPALKPSEY